MANPCQPSTQPAAQAAAPKSPVNPRKLLPPVELWCHVFEFLDASSLRSVQGVCRLFREAVGKIQWRCVPDSQTIDCVISEKPASFRLRRIQFTHLLKGMCLLSAQEIARTIEDGPFRVNALLEIGKELAKIGAESEEIKRPIEEARDIAKAIEDVRRKDLALAEIARTEAQVGLFEDAKATVKEIENTDTMEGALAGIALVELEAGLLEEAKTMAEGIRRTSLKSMVLSHIVEAEIQLCLFEDAKATASGMGSLTSAFTLANIAVAEAEAGLFADAKATTGQIEDARHHTSALKGIAVAEAEAGLFVDAKATADRIDDVTQKAAILIRIAAQLAKRQPESREIRSFREIAKAIVNGIADIRRKTLGLMMIAVEEIDAGLFEEAKVTVNEIETGLNYPQYNDTLKAELLENITMEEAKAGAQAGLFEDAKAKASEIGSVGMKGEALAGIAVAEAQAGLFEDAKVTANEIGVFVAMKAEAFAGIAVAEAQAGLFEDAKVTVNRIELSNWKDQALVAIAEAEIEASLLGEAKATIDMISSVLEKIRALVELASIASIVPTESTMGKAITTAKVGQVVRIRMNDFSVVPPRGKGPTLSPHAHFLFDFAGLPPQL